MRCTLLRRTGTPRRTRPRIINGSIVSVDMTNDHGCYFRLLRVHLRVTLLAELTLRRGLISRGVDYPIIKTPGRDRFPTPVVR